MNNFCVVSFLYHSASSHIPHCGSAFLPLVRPDQRHGRWRRLERNRRASPALTRSSRASFHGSAPLGLNRFLFDLSEIDDMTSVNGKSDNDNKNVDHTGVVRTVTLAKTDYRTVHASKILGLKQGDTVRAGIVGDGGGWVTDSARIAWLSPEVEKKKAGGDGGVGGGHVPGNDETRAPLLGPLKNGDPPGPLRMELHDLVASSSKTTPTPSVNLLLALPRPLQLGRILPMVAQVGVNHLVLSSARKVPRDYFGSHLLREPRALQQHLVEGLCLAGDVALPRTTVVKNLKKFLENDDDDNELERCFPRREFARVIAHPTSGPDDLRMRDVVFPFDSDHGNHQPKILLAIGPEGGWTENEVSLFVKHGFQQVTLGPRILRSDVAVVSLLSLAHDRCNEYMRNSFKH